MIRPTAKSATAPLPAVQLRGFDCRRHAAIAERQQRLVVRVPLALDVEVGVVDAGDQLVKPLHLAFDRGRRLHRQPLIRGPWLGHQRVDAGDDPSDAPARAGVVEVGALADLIIVDGDPMADLSIFARPNDALKAVIRDGVMTIDRLPPANRRKAA